MTAHPTKELRLALAMRGGVSLAVWIGGGVREVDRLRTDLVGPAEGCGALGRLAVAMGYRSVAVDVMTGASAGGLNAVIYGTALASSTSVDRLREVWAKEGDLSRLQRRVGSGRGLDVLDGDYFGDAVLRAVVAQIEGTGGSGVAVPEVDRIDVHLAVSSVLPTERVTAIDPRHPETESSIEGVIHLSHRAGPAPVAHSDFTGPPGFPLRNARRLAQAARATAAFPVAFGPVEVEREGELWPRVHAGSPTPDPLVLYDGGVVDNMPVGRAARSIETAPAEGPTTRCLLYLFPSPDVDGGASTASRDDDAERIRRAGADPLDIATSAMKSLRTKSLAADLRQIEEHNAGVKVQQAERARLLTDLFGPEDETRKVGWERLVPSDETADHALDAERLVGMLADPEAHLDGIVPLPKADPLWPNMKLAEREAIVARIEARAPEVPAPARPPLARGSLRPWGALIRVSTLLIEACRLLDGPLPTPVLDQHKGRLYRHRDVAYTAASVLNHRTLAHPEVMAACEQRNPVAVADAIVAARTAILAGAVGIPRLVPPDTTWAAWLEQEWAQVVADGIEVCRRAAVRRKGGDGVLEVPDERWPGERSDALIRALAAAAPAPDPAAPPIAVVDPATWTGDRLGAVDVALKPLHRCRPLPSLSRIDYRTVSGLAESPLSDEYVWPADARPAGISTFGTLEPVGVTALDNAVRPRSKLAGNQLHNFAAFFDETWRDSDWMWGQLDASVTLVDVLLTREGRLPPGLADEVERIVTGPADAEEPTALDAQGRALWCSPARDGLTVGAVVKAEIGAGQATDEPVDLGLTRAVLVWRRQAEIVDAHLPGADRQSLQERMTAWDDAPRSLWATWGRSATSTVGLRSAAAAIRAVTARRAWWSRPLRAALTPLMAPVALALGRRRSVASLLLVIVGVVGPRCLGHGGGRLAVAVAALVVAVGGLALTRRREAERARPIDRTSVVASWVFVVLAWGAVAAGAVTGLGDLPVVPPLGPQGGAAELALTGQPGWWLGGPAAAMALAVWWSWSWAQLRWRLAAAGGAAAVLAGWVALGAQGDALTPALRPLGSLWWCLGVVLPVAFGLLTFGVDVYRDPARPADELTAEQLRRAMEDAIPRRQGDDGLDWLRPPADGA